MNKTNILINRFGCELPAFLTNKHPLPSISIPNMLLGSIIGLIAAMVFGPLLNLMVGDLWGYILLALSVGTIWEFIIFQPMIQRWVDDSKKILVAINLFRQDLSSEELDIYEVEQICTFGILLLDIPEAEISPSEFEWNTEVVLKKVLDLTAIGEKVWQNNKTSDSTSLFKKGTRWCKVLKDFVGEFERHEDRLSEKAKQYLVDISDFDMNCIQDHP